MVKKASGVAAGTCDHSLCKQKLEMNEIVRHIS